MAEPISLASGLLTLVVFSHQACVTLYTTIQSFKGHPKRVRDLVDELKTLIGVLESLSDTVRSTTDVDLSALDLPLQRCGHACEEFLQELQKCSSRSGGDRKSFRDWAKLRYMGDNIDGFKDSLAAYKSTIIVALTDVQLRNSSVTVESLKEYKKLIETATNDLEARLETIDEKLETIIERTATDSEVTELGSMKEERLSTQKCLMICARLSELIDQLRPISTDGSSSRDGSSIPEKITSDGIQECKASMEQTTLRLERHMQDVLDRILASSKTTAMTQDDSAYLARLREEWDTARQCREILAKADQHVKDNISIIDNHATGDETVQFLVSNSQKTIHGKNRGYGFHIKQLGGHLSDQSIQKLSGDFLQMSMQNSARVVPKPSSSSPVQGDVSSGADDVDNRRTDWQPHYGGGRTLKSRAGLVSPAVQKSSGDT